MKNNLIVVLGSITNAARVKKLLYTRYRISVKTIHTPAQLGGKGCSHSIKTQPEHLAKILQVAEDMQIVPKGVYFEETDKNGVTYHALS